MLDEMDWVNSLTERTTPCNAFGNCLLILIHGRPDID